MPHANRFFVLPNITGRLDHKIIKNQLHHLLQKTSSNLLLKKKYSQYFSTQFKISST